MQVPVAAHASPYLFQPAVRPHYKHYLHCLHSQARLVTIAPLRIFPLLPLSAQFMDFNLSSEQQQFRDAVSGFADVVALALQPLAQRPANQVLVVDDQDGGAAHGGSLLRV